MQGPITNEKILSFKDVNKREIAFLVPIIVLMFWMGIYPKPFLRKMDASVTHLLNQVSHRERVFLEADRDKGLAIEIKKAMEEVKPEEREKKKHE